MAFDLATDLLWKTSNHATSTASVVVTHPDAGGTAAGSTVLVYLRSASATNFSLPTGWVQDNVPGLPFLWALRLDNAAAGETSWTFTRNASGNTAWSMLECAHLAFAESFEVATAGTSGTNGTGTTRSTGTTTLNAGITGLVVAVFGSTKAASGDTHSWASYTNSFTEQEDFNPSGVAGQCIAVAAKNFSSQSTFETTATFTTSTGTPSTGATVLVYRSDDAAINAPLAHFTGYEWGTYGGMGNAAANNPGGGSVSGVGTVGTNIKISAAAAKNGDFGLEIDNSSTSILYVFPSLAAANFSASGYVQAVSGSGTPVVMNFRCGTEPLLLSYDITNEKFGLGWSNGTTVWQTGTSPAATYPGVQVRARCNSSVYHAEWWIETGTGDGYQTPPTDLTGRTAATSISVQQGGTSSQTGRFYYDDWVISPIYAAWPLGLHRVSRLVPDGTGATVSGTSTNFQRFTSNGTLANVTGTEGALLDEAPPTVGASSDGVVQVAVAASDYLNLPMGTYTLGDVEIIAGVRFLASLWGGTGTGTGTLGWRGHDGLTETIFVAASTSYDADSLTAVSSTYPLWNSAMWSGASNGAWTQTRLDAAAIRMGFSTDATPDMGASAVYLEVAIVDAPRFIKHRLVDAEDPGDNAAVVYEYVNPYNSGTRAYSIDNQDPVRSVTFTYTVGGTPTPVTVNAGDPEQVVAVDEAALGNVTATLFGWS